MEDGEHYERPYQCKSPRIANIIQGVSLIVCKIVDVVDVERWKGRRAIGGGRLVWGRHWKTGGSRGSCGNVACRGRGYCRYAL